VNCSDCKKPSSQKEKAAGEEGRGEQLTAITKEIVEPVAGDISVALIAALHRLLSSVPSMQS
jgi:hypothetical protein